MVVTEFIFFDAAGHPLFVRMDAEQANWQEDELSLTAVFPYIDGKVIRRGMRIGFEDQDGVLQPFEIRKVKNYEKDHRQELTCEHIAIAELTDVHYSGSEHENITARAALEALLAAQPEALGGNRWQIGNVTASGTSSGDLSMGSVWQNVRTIEQNWNVYITPRVTFGTAGIAGRYLDITPAGGVWRGIRLSLDVNADEVGVTIDDTETLTALYGYGGNAINQETGAASTEKVTFASVTWAKTADHPAKPAGQTYLEDADATRDFGRNGQPRFGFYQNGDITDPALLLQKTWEALKATNHPRVTVDCLLKELVRYGYRGQAVRLHDLVHVELRPMGFMERLEVIKRGVNLLDPTATRVTIGAYIPNIVYIQRQTSFQALGASVTTSRRRGYGSGKSAQSDKEAEWSEYRTRIEANNRKIELAAEHVDKANRILEAAGIGINTEGVVVYATDNVNKIGSRFQVEADKISAVVGATGITDPADLVWRFGELYKVIGRDADGNPTMFEKVTSQQAQLSAIKQTADGVSAEVATARGNSTLKSVLDLKENTATLAVIKDTNGNISAAKIVAKINKTTGDSNAIIQADHVYLDANKTANIGNSFFMSSGQIWIKKAVMIGESSHVTFNNGTMNAPTVQVNSGGALKFSPSSQSGTVISIDHAKASGLLTEVQIAQPASGSNTYTLQYKKVGGGDTWFTPANGTFSRAIASWTAVAGNGAVTMTANPQNQALTHAVKPIKANNAFGSTFTSNVYNGDAIVSGIGMKLVANTTDNVVEARLVDSTLASDTLLAKLPVTFGGNVTFGDWTWNSYAGSSYPSQRTVSIDAADSGGGSDTASLSMMLSPRGWNKEGAGAYKQYVNLYAPNTDNTVRAQVTVDATSLVSSAPVSGSWDADTQTFTAAVDTSGTSQTASTKVLLTVQKASTTSALNDKLDVLVHHDSVTGTNLIASKRVTLSANNTAAAALSNTNTTRTGTAKVRAGISSTYYAEFGHTIAVDGGSDIATAGGTSDVTFSLDGVVVGRKRVKATYAGDASGNVMLTTPSWSAGVCAVSTTGKATNDSVTTTLTDLGLGSLSVVTANSAKRLTLGYDIGYSNVTNPTARAGSTGKTGTINVGTIATTVTPSTKEITAKGGTANVLVKVGGVEIANETITATYDGGANVGLAAPVWSLGMCTVSTTGKTNNDSVKTILHNMNPNNVRVYESGSDKFLYVNYDVHYATSDAPNVDAGSTGKTGTLNLGKITVTGAGDITEQNGKKTVEVKVGNTVLGSGEVTASYSGGSGANSVEYYQNGWKTLSTAASDSDVTYIASTNPHFRVYSGSTLTHRFAVNVGNPKNAQEKNLGTLTANTDYEIVPDSGYDFLTKVKFTTPGSSGGGNYSFSVPTKAKSTGTANAPSSDFMHIGTIVPSKTQTRYWTLVIECDGHQKACYIAAGPAV